MPACMHLCMSVFMYLCHIQYAHVRICLRVCEHAFECTHSGEEVRLNKWEIFTHVWAKVHSYTLHSCDTLHTLTTCEVRRLKMVPSPSRHLAVSCQDFLGHTEGVPFHTAICLIVVVQQGCSGTSELSNLPTSGGWLGSGKSSNSVCVWVCVVKMESSLKPWLRREHNTANATRGESITKAM